MTTKWNVCKSRTRAQHSPVRCPNEGISPLSCLVILGRNTEIRCNTKPHIRLGWTTDGGLQRVAVTGVSHTYDWGV